MVDLDNIFLTDKSSKNNKCSLKLLHKNNRKILKVFLLGYLHKLFCEIFKKKIQISHNNSSMECYVMDNKIIQLLIHGIIETGEYTLEGIAQYTRIPFDIIFDAACGQNKNLSVTLLARIVNIYIQVKPDVTQMLINKLLDMKEKNPGFLTLLLNEK